MVALGDLNCRHQVWAVCSNQLSYKPVRYYINFSTFCKPPQIKFYLSMENNLKIVFIMKHIGSNDDMFGRLRNMLDNGQNNTIAHDKRAGSKNMSYRSIFNFVPDCQNEVSRFFLLYVSFGLAQAKMVSR